MYQLFQPHIVHPLVIRNSNAEKIVIPIYIHYIIQSEKASFQPTSVINDAMLFTKEKSVPASLEIGNTAPECNWESSSEGQTATWHAPANQSRQHNSHWMSSPRSRSRSSYHRSLWLFKRRYLGIQTIDSFILRSAFPFVKALQLRRNVHMIRVLIFANMISAVRRR